MKHLLTYKLFEGKEELSFTDPELDYQEFFRLYNHFNEELPKNIDKELFDSSVYYAEIITKKMNSELRNKFNIENGLDVKDNIDEKWYPFIDFVYSNFKKGKKEDVGLDFLNNIYFGEDIRKNRQSFHNFIKTPNYREILTDKGLKEYYESFDWFDKNQSKISLPVIQKLKGKYYLVGGNRRLSWLISKGQKNIPVWLIK